MRHPELRWNAAHQQWFCIVCGCTSDQKARQEAERELESIVCQLPIAEDVCNTASRDAAEQGHGNASELPEWVGIYHAAMLELDLARLPAKVAAARKAVEKALLALSPMDRWENSRRLQDALHNLRIVERELGPDAHFHSELAGKFVAVVDPSRKYVAVTDDVCELLGFSRAELLSKKIDDVTAPAMKDSVPDTFQKYVDLGYMTGTHQLLRRDGAVVAIRYEAKAFPDGCLVARWNPE
jgi:PAS domain S-box-containing protein